MPTVAPPVPAGELAAGEELARELPRLPAYPALFQLNTRVRLRALEGELGRTAMLDDIPDAELDGIAAQGFDWVYFLGVWSTGEAGRNVSRTNPDWHHGFEALLPDLDERDICGSSFAITAYAAHPAMGGNEALARLRRRLHARGLRLMLDFVPNHMAPDHPWAWERPELFVRGSEAQLEREPGNYLRIETARGTMVLAHGRDPYFPGWPDTLQLDYGNPATGEAMRGELLAAASLCDGLRCDMAMLILPDVFQRTWGIAAEPFWPGATRAVRDRSPGFVFAAEVYWDLEWTMLQQGFDYAYDKSLYDRLAARNGRAVREHLLAGLDYQRHLVRFLENHDEPRAAGTFPWDVHQAAAAVAFLSPGLRFFHQGQFEGRREHVSIHLNRAPVELPDSAVGEFYRRLLEVLRTPVLRNGDWRLLAPIEAWPGNWTWAGFVPALWEGNNGECLMVVVNFQPNQAQCYIRLPVGELAGRPLDLIDLLGPARYRREGDDLMGRGLYLDLPPWGFHLFRIEAAE
ncbi:alpha-amylase family glycosyl hydrolase [Siccirubricoccus sp. G192]|uniref:alpha-amylase family glycosyl hydrolase n=1 Tax=Siccirubricoccus sp. G192 TaxID=2849651 RepID=UPI001C2B7A4B|nr:alpha-amylase family glycosyl hydrolase [Siccirubricoccus sp. G192]MBV1798895.1 alpha-amylase [Siccirubricoccus sp. G192]